MKRFVTGLLLAALAAGCAHYPLNDKLARADITTGYRYANTTLPREDGLYVILTFSGGGSRAAGFAYGVLREMERTKLPDGSRLIDRIDVISSVSGGSFISTYFGLYGPDGLDNFKTKFLERNIEGMLFRAAVNPVNVARLLSPNFSRIDLASEIYDKTLFEGKTFADLLAAQAPGRRPFIIINSTELDLGSRFEWTQDQFDPLCSDLSTTLLARGVAASSAFPVLLTPMVLRDYANETNCGFTPPSWVANAREDIELNPTRHRNAVELLAYLEPRRQWLHLMDGGIADNIGLRGPLHAITSSDTWQMDDPARRRNGFTIQGELNRREIKRLLVISVNAATHGDVKLDAKQANPGLPAILGNISFTPMANFSFDSLQMLRSTMNELELRQRQPIDCQQAVSGTCPEARIPGSDLTPVSFYPVVLGFTSIPDKKFRDELNAVGTNFALKPGQLELLERAAKELLAGSEEYQRFLEEVGAQQN